MKNLAPIVIFTFKRLDTVIRTIESLKQCDLASESDLFIFSDHYLHEKDKQDVLNVRAYINSVKGFKSVSITESKYNKGLANSVISGVDEVISKYGKVIVLEDDLITSKNFLTFMNSSLEFYGSNNKVFSVSGYTIPLKLKTSEPDVYFLPRACSWGWGTWIDRWQKADWEVKNFSDFTKLPSNIDEFNLGGSDMFGMLQKQVDGSIDSWAIRWCYAQYQNKGLSVYPTVSKVQNIGFGKSSTHTYVYNRYTTNLDEGNSHSFIFNSIVETQPEMLSQFQDFFSLKTRFIGRIKTYLMKSKLLKAYPGHA